MASSDCASHPRPLLEIGINSPNEERLVDWFPGTRRQLLQAVFILDFFWLLFTGGSGSSTPPHQGAHS